MSGLIDTLTAERDDLARRLRQIATDAELKSDGTFTSEQMNEVNDLKSQFLKVTADLSRAKSLDETRTGVDNLLRDDEESTIRSGVKAASRAGRTSTPLGKSITAHLFGDKSPGVNPQGRQFFDTGGVDHKAGRVSPLNSKAGYSSVPTLRPSNGTSVFGLPENGARLLPLLTPVPVLDGTYRFYRQVSRTDLIAGFVPPLQPKPSEAFEYEMVTDHVRMIAVLSDPLSVQELQDVPGLRDDVGNELSRRVIRTADWAIVNGDDTIPDQFDGILKSAGVLDVPFAVDTLTTLRKALTVLQNRAYAPTAYAVNPTDWEAIELLRDGDGKLLYAATFSTGVVPRLFGIPVVIADVLPAGTAILADWKSGVLAERGQIDVAWTDAGDLFTTNAIRFRAEARIGFNLTQPSAFAVAHLTAGP